MLCMKALVLVYEALSGTSVYEALKLKLDSGNVSEIMPRVELVHTILCIKARTLVVTRRYTKPLLC